jgi:putative N6-adenine-specific DNA methylase
VALEELRAIGVGGQAEHGGVAFGGGLAALYRVHLHARIPVRVWARVGRRSGVRSLEGLAAAIRAMPWPELVWARQPVAVQVATHQVRWGRRETIANKAELAIRDALRVPRRETRRPPREPADILVRMEGDQLEVSIDASGERLHRRGWRRDTSEAPLRENLAAAVLWLAEWEPGEALVDPMCGSGTFAIEAATIAARSPPGRSRSFAFEAWPSFDAALWGQIRGEPMEGPIRTRIAASDLDPEAVKIARANARRAGVESAIDFAVCDVGAAPLTGRPGLIVANPPYGERLRRADAAWANLGRWLTTHGRGWRVALVSPDAGWLRRAGLTLPAVGGFSNGGIRVTVFCGEIEANKANK